MIRIAAVLLVVAGAYLLHPVLVASGFYEALGAWGTALARPIVVPLVELLSAPAFVFVASLVIVLAGIALCLLYIFRKVRPQLAALRSVGEALAYLSTMATGEKMPWMEIETQLTKIFARSGLFVTAWAMFRADAPNARRFSAQPFAFYVSNDPHSPENERAGVMHGMPGYFTSVGLILTFAGLVVALYFAAKGFRSGNIEEARGAIIQLLNASSFKFLTSVAALVSALMISVCLRVCQSLVRAESQHLVARIEGLLALIRTQQVHEFPLDPGSQAIVDRLDAMAASFAALRESLARPDEAPALAGLEVRP